MSYRSPRQSLSKAYLKAPVSRPEIEQFKSAFVTMQGRIDPEKNEEHLKNVIRDFLLNAYYQGEHEINVKGNQDMVIHNGPKTSDSVGVIIEAKSIKNTNEMVTRDELNKKALRELILYYLREREDSKNISIKQLIITNASEWFIFDGNQFEKLVYRNVKLMKSYKEYKRDGKDTRYFYEVLAKPFIEDIKDQLEYTWFDITKYKKVITNEDKTDDKKLVALFKLLSPTHILKKSFSNDSNSLNRNFYNELLHIIGLEEVSNKGKKVIQRKAEEKREPASLLENTINILKYDTNVVESKHFDTALELCITWINRVLFLKLLESQLITYNKGDDSYRFLDYGRLKNYDALNKLFFQVLAIRPADRRPTVQVEYAKVPYLNSSLFEVSQVEERAIRISGLEDDGKLSIHTTTVLKGEKGKRAKGEINTLEYLFRFLEAYNFSSEGGEQIQEENKSLINASVLGLIFEKINGYKDGSFFTPGFITMYMCSETIRRSIMQKFRDQSDYDSEDWGELKNYIGKPYKKEDLQQYNNLIDSIKICDPAVGSGHFLVSALNEMIAIKSELGILCSSEYSKLPVIATVDNDELILENENADHTLYEYDYQSTQSQMVQQAIFHEKKKIIENCLFGVDINPNSVKICRLRLWIELLKNAYYTAESKYTDLETLPNIDINIKCGNSLISRFDLDSDLKPALKKSKFTIDAYKLAVQNYKQATDKEQKRAFKKLIQTVKADFKSDIFSKDKIDLQKLEGQFYERFGTATLIDVELTKAQAKKKAAEQKKLVAKIDKRKAEIEETQNNKIYENAFEWRFEFPEVLDDEGVYVGFDIVIGNPPWGAKLPEAVLKEVKINHSEIVVRMVDSFMFFINLTTKIVSKNGYVSQIIPDVFLYQADNELLRRKLLISQRLELAINLGDNIFQDVARGSCIILFSNSEISSCLLADLSTEREDSFENIEFNEVAQNEIGAFPKALIPFRNIEGYKLLNKYSTRTLSDVIDQDGIQRGISPDLKSAFVVNDETINKYNLENEFIRPTITGGRDTDLYYTSPIDKFIIYTKKGDDTSNFPCIVKYLTMFKELITCKEVKLGKHPFWSLHRARNKDIFIKEIKILGVITGDTVKVSIDDSQSHPTDGMYIMASNDILSNYTLVGILNSKLITYFYRLLSMEIGRVLSQVKPTLLQILPFGFKLNLSLDVLNLIEDKTIEIVEIKKLSISDTTHLEAEIDQLVYQLYDLTEEEIQIIEESVGG